MMRAINGAGAVRFGIVGSLSAINSPIASRENITTAAVDPMNASGEPCKFNQLRCAPMPLQRARSMNATRPQFRFQERERKRSSMKFFLFWLPSKTSFVQRHQNDHGEINPAAPLDLRSRQA